MDERDWQGLNVLKTGALRAKYRELFGEESKSANKQYLVRRITWRLQASAEGGLSERARQRAAEIADIRDLRTRLPADFSAREAWARGRSRHDWRIPRPGTLITRRFENRQIVVRVLDDGFEYESRHYRSLSAIAREVTGTRWNGLLFFGRAQRKSAGSARTGSDQATGRGQNIVGVNGDVSADKVTKPRGGTDR